MQQEEKHYRKRLDDQQAVVQRLTAQQTLLEQEYTVCFSVFIYSLLIWSLNQNWRTEVENRYDEVKDPRSAKQVEKELKNKKAAHQRSLEEYVHRNSGAHNSNYRLQARPICG
jgi:hypothetical protein